MYKFSEKSVDEARLEGFYFKGVDFDHLPPSSDALKQHVLRAVYQSGHIWGKSLLGNFEAPDPTNWGWSKCGAIWKPTWILSGIISKTLPQLVTCKCKTTCKPPCKCAVNNVACTQLCACRGMCFRDMGTE